MSVLSAASGQGTCTWFVTKREVVKLRMVDERTSTLLSAAETLRATYVIREIKESLAATREVVSVYRVKAVKDFGVDEVKSRSFPSLEAAEMYARTKGALDG